MKGNLLHIMIFMFVAPLTVVAQLSLDATEHAFYKDLAIKDAQHELSLPQLSKEDEADFWADQKDFEVQLFKANPAAYRIYLNTKGMAYRQYQLLYGENYGDHSEEFARQAAFYIVRGQLDEEVVYATKAKLSTPKK